MSQLTGSVDRHYTSVDQTIQQRFTEVERRLDNTDQTVAALRAELDALKAKVNVVSTETSAAAAEGIINRELDRDIDPTIIIVRCPHMVPRDR
eukprot:6804428-Pyramimonas_sp.AAC.1